MRFLRRRRQGVVDIVAKSPEGDRYMVAIVHDEPWRHEETHLLGLQERIIDCLTFITGGQMDELHPDSVGMPKLVQVFHAEPPDSMTAEFFARVKVALQAEGIGFETEQLS